MSECALLSRCYESTLKQMWLADNGVLPGEWLLLLPVKEGELYDNQEVGQR